MSLEIYGSSVNGLAQQLDSDLDLTLLVDNFEVSHELILKCVRSSLFFSGRFECLQEPRQI